MTMPLASTKLVLQGAGKMGMAMLEGWLKAGLEPQNTVVFDPHPSDALLALAQHGLNINPQTQVEADIVVLATKPQILAEAWAGLAPIIPSNTAVLSIAAGKTIASLQSLCGERPIIRAMPNTPASISRGITALVANNETNDDTRALCQTLLEAVGQVVWIEDETLMDAVTGVSGSGPAYVFHMVEAMAAAGVANGLPHDIAMQLARATVSGAGALLDSSLEDAATLRKNVTSPKGTTEAALTVLMSDEALTSLMTQAITAAVKRGQELGKT